MPTRKLIEFSFSVKSRGTELTRDNAITITLNFNFKSCNPISRYNSRGAENCSSETLIDRSYRWSDVFGVLMTNVYKTISQGTENLINL